MSKVLVIDGLNPKILQICSVKYELYRLDTALTAVAHE